MAFDLTAVLRLKDEISAPMKKINAQMDQLNRISGQTTSSMMSFANTLPSITAGASTAVAAMAPLAAGAAGLASSMAAGGAGVAAFATVASSELGKVFDAADQVDKINEKIAQADTAKEQIAAQKELAAVYAGMNKAQAGALKDLQGFKSFWGGFTKGFQSPIFAAFGQGLQATEKLLKGLEPTIMSVANVTTDVMTRINSAMKGSTMKGFFTWLEQNAARSLSNFAAAAGNTFAGVINVLQAFAPTGAQMETGLVSLTEKFRTWSETLAQSNGFKAFITYAQQNGPVLVQLFSNLAAIIGKTAVALAPLGTTLLQGLSTFTSYVRDNFSTIAPIVGSVIAAFAGFKIVTTVITLVQGAIAVFGILKNVFMIVKTAFMAVRLAMLLFPGTWIVAAIGAVVAAGIWMYKNWDTVKEKAGQLWASISEKWDAFKSKTTDAFSSVKTAIGNAMDSAKEKVSNFFSPLLSFISDAKQRFDSLVNSVKSFKMPSIKFPSMPSWMGKLTGGGSSGEKVNGSAYHGLERVPYDGFTARLHKDERVLTADEAAEYNSGGSNKIVNLTVNYSGEKMNESEMERFVAFLNRKLAQAESGGVV